MKFMYRFLVIIFIPFFLSLNVTKTQDWQWDWAKKTHENVIGAELNILSSDLLNNYYFNSWYTDSIYFPDTLFGHSINTSSTTNYVIAQYSTRGEFQRAIDLYTQSGYRIHFPDVLTDQELNIYISGGFEKIIYFQDTLLNHSDPVNQSLNDIFVIKLDENQELEWANIIGGTLEDRLVGFEIVENKDIYIVTNHEANEITPSTVYFLEQDTAVYEQEFSSFTKIDKNGTIEWRIDILGDLHGSFLEPGKNGKLYIYGSSFTDIILLGDTIIKPFTSEYEHKPYILSFDTTGQLISGEFFEFGLYPSQIEVSEESEFYISGTIKDTLILNLDTIITPIEWYGKILVKFDLDFQPVWYKVFIADADQVISSFDINYNEEKLIFSTICDNNVQFEDTILSLGQYYYETILGEYSSDGQLINILATNGQKDLVSGHFIEDNCNNLVLTGKFEAKAYFGNDTLVPYSYQEDDFFIAKIKRGEQYTIELGSDTIACMEFTIQGPENFYYYLWNDQLTNQSWHTVYESGLYYLGCSNENGCWAFDSIYININPGIFPDLISDTTIRENDTIKFILPVIYDSYLWSDGSTSNTLAIKGNEYGIGDHQIWVEVTDGPCTHIDSIILIIKSEFGIEDYLSSAINIFPNPFEDEITVEIKPTYNIIDIFDLNGIRLFTKNINQANKVEQINLNDLKRGIYLLKVKTTEHNFIKKIIKI